MSFQDLHVSPESDKALSSFSSSKRERVLKASLHLPDSNNKVEENKDMQDNTQVPLDNHKDNRQWHWWNLFL